MTLQMLIEWAQRDWDASAWRGVRLSFVHAGLLGMRARAAYANPGMGVELA